MGAVVRGGSTSPVAVHTVDGGALGGSTPEGPRTLSDVLAAPHLPALDGLRMIAVFMVIIFHYVDGPADLGVSLFFVLSGFLITWLLLKERDKTGHICLRNFYVRRTLRIFPAYYAYLALCITLALWRGRIALSGPLVACALTYTMNYYEALLGGPANFISHGWSLAQEEQFYLLWPGVFLLLARHGPRAVVRGLGLTIAAVVVWRSYLYLLAGVGAPYIYHAFDTRLDTLAIGCAMAMVAHRGLLSRAAFLVTARPWLPLCTVALLAASRLNGSNRYHYSLGFTVDAVLMAILILQAVLLHEHPMWRWLDHPIARYLGKISYPLYLYHPLAWSVGHRLQDLPTAVPIALTLLASIVMAAASYHLVEKKFLALKTRFAV